MVAGRFAPGVDSLHSTLCSNATVGNAPATGQTLGRHTTGGIAVRGQRWMGFAITVVVVMVAAGCLPMPPSNPSPPLVEAVVVSPDPVVAGAPFTVTVSASDDVAVTGLRIEIRTPSALNSATDLVYPHVTCDDPPFTPQPSVTRTFTCSLPSFVPNGAWRLWAFASDGGTPGAGSSPRTTFGVTGGSEDRQAPVLEYQSITPSPVVIGQPFQVTLRVSDEHPLAPAPTAFQVSNIVDTSSPHPSPYAAWPCPPVAPTQLTPTLQEFVFTCVVPPTAVLGSYGGFMLVLDAIGYDLGAFIDPFTVVAAS